MNASEIEGPGAAVVAPAAQARSFRLYRHLVIGLAIALIAPFTALAWPFAILLGIVIGRDDVERRRGIPRSAAVKAIRLLAVTGGVLAMMLFGALIGGLVAFLIAALAFASEQAAGDAPPTDRLIARLVIFLMPIVGYVLLFALGMQINIRIGS